MDRPPHRLRRVRACGITLLGVVLSATQAQAGSLPDAEGVREQQTLSVVSYNVHGLPWWIAFDDPQARLPRVRPLLAAYDVAFVQEDWWYPELLAAGTPGGLDLRVARAGLRLLAKLAPRQLVSQESRAYGRCAGWILGANDCLAEKGALRARVRLDDGVEVDLWNTHLDAGLGEADQAARVAQLDALRERIARESPGRALVLAGDFNLDWDRSDHRAAFEAFRSGAGLADSGARAAHWERRAGVPGRVDYVLFRSSDRVTLDPIEAGEAPGFEYAGRPLSDHPAVYAKFRWTAPSRVAR